MLRLQCSWLVEEIGKIPALDDIEVQWHTAAPFSKNR